MKKLLLLCSFISSTVFAQNLNVARHAGFDSPVNMVSINSKSFYLESFLYDSMNLVGLSNSGQILFKTLTGIPPYYIRTPIKVIKTLDKKILVSGYMEMECDVTSAANFIGKYDTTGQLAWKTLVQGVSVIQDLTEHPDSSFYLIGSGPNIPHYSKSGTYLSTLSTSFTSLSSITALQNGNLLLNGSTSNGRQNMIITTTGSIVTQQNTSFTITGLMESSSGIIYALEKNGSIQTYSSNLQALNNSVVATGSNIRLKDFKVRNDTSFCTGFLLPFNKAYYAMLAPDLSLVYQSQSNYKNVYPSGITVNNMNRVSIISEGTSTVNTRLSFIGLHQTSTTGSFVSRYDIGVTGFSVLGHTVLPFMWGGYAINMVLAVQVKNFTNDTIKSFYLNHIQSYCGGGLHKKYMEVIPPNGVITTTTNTFYITVYLPSPTNTVDVCVNTTVPNFENDINIDNDSWCGSLIITRPVGIFENTLSDNSINLYPNPAQTSFNVEAAHKITKIEVTNVTGQLMRTEYSDNTFVHFETNDWPNGIYFLKIETDAGTSVKKVFKN